MHNMIMKINEKVKIYSQRESERERERGEREREGKGFHYAFITDFTFDMFSGALCLVVVSVKGETKIVSLDRVVRLKKNQKHETDSRSLLRQQDVLL